MAKLSMCVILGGGGYCLPSSPCFKIRSVYGLLRHLSIIFFSHLKNCGGVCSFKMICMFLNIR